MCKRMGSKETNKWFLAMEYLVESDTMNLERI